VNEECEGSKACEIKPILGACPPPIPLPAPKRRPKPRDQVDSLNEQLQRVDLDGLGDQNLEIEVGKNATQGPPLWHCARNKDGSKCLCCCGWYFPDAKSGKCVNIRNQSAHEDDDQIWNWSGLTDLDFQYPFGLDKVVGDQVIEQIEAPPVDTDQQMAETDEEAGVIDQMQAPDQQEAKPQAVEPTAHQVAAPVTDTVIDKKKIEKKPFRETNEI